MEKVASKAKIDFQLINEAMNYDEYTALLTKLLSEGKTTGENQSEEMLHYAKLNLQRMKRLNKTIELSSKLKTTLSHPRSKKMIWLVITEGWCGDAAQNIPLINHIAEKSVNIELKLILRDQHLEIMDQFLTNGSRSIPKLIALNATDLSILGTWGPRANEAQKMVETFKKQTTGDYQEFAKVLQLWYAKDKTSAQQEEFESLIPTWAN
tara:strand:- start:959 stop:1585 length:627 start_codon:yes stop_codon:yes gene_type:complete